MALPSDVVVEAILVGYMLKVAVVGIGPPFLYASRLVARQNGEHATLRTSS